MRQRCGRRDPTPSRDRSRLAGSGASAGSNRDLQEERATAGGFEGGGGATPRQSANVQHRVCWLVHLSVAKPAPWGTRENVPPGIARNSLDRAVTVNLIGLLAASPANREERPATPSRFDEGGALCRAPVSPNFGPVTPPRGLDAPALEPEGVSVHSIQWRLRVQVDRCIDEPPPTPHREHPSLSAPSDRESRP